MWSLPEILEINREPRPDEPTNRDGLPILKRRGDTVDPVKGFLRRKALLGGKAPRGTYTYIGRRGDMRPMTRTTATRFLLGHVPITFEPWEFDGVKMIIGNHCLTIYWTDEKEN